MTVVHTEPVKARDQGEPSCCWCSNGAGIKRQNRTTPACRNSESVSHAAPPVRRQAGVTLRGRVTSYPCSADHALPDQLMRQSPESLRKQFDRVRIPWRSWQFVQTAFMARQVFSRVCTMYGGAVLANNTYGEGTRASVRTRATADEAGGSKTPTPLDSSASLRRTSRHR